jgi:hypothetical protein
MSDTTGGPAFPTPAHNLQNDGMTLREYAAIKLKVPDSGTVWLDEMIAQSLRDEVAAKAMQGHWLSIPPEHAAKRAYEYADAMLKARES